ncbi:hypothetical protein BDP27DRAFT_1276778 [Rhodocollybia butyracea]|uniref:F-box domain-containing protein n=1 Tax=Rhodocollybia butyracea TaxID=206335 RepID=A0A9P5P7W5_9AGAR|nr:hypothetical protein BDP27DRAFT_1276778 [Rhodocollybia butyracea]
MNFWRAFFGYVCIENDLSYGPRCPSAMALGSVCLRWRQLTIECPELWSNMTINVSDWGRFGAVQRRTASLVNLYLARSKSHPLDLSMSGSEYLGDSETPLFSQIAQQSFRWKHVFVTTDTYLFPENYRTWNSLDLPILDTLALSASDPDDGNECSLRMLTNTPMLRAFYAWELYCLWDQSSGFPLPSARTMLHDFQYDGNVNNFCEILENCPNIHRLSVWTRGQNSTIVACPPRTLSELSSLSITLDSSREESVEESWPSVLSSLTTPHLTNLVIQRTCGLKKRYSAILCHTVIPRSLELLFTSPLSQKHSRD